MQHATRTVQQAWLESDWFAGLERAPDASRADKTQLVQPAFVASVTRTMQRALQVRSQDSVWLAAHPGWGVSQASLDPDTNGNTNPLVGYAHSKHDVSGSRLEQRLKRTLYPDKVYAAVGDVAIQTAWQGSGVGVAMFDAALSGFAENKVPTTYVLGDNQPLIDTLEGYGYQVTGLRPREDLVEGFQIAETRLQAESVGAVRERLIQSHPWLQTVVEL